MWRAFVGGRSPQEYRQEAMSRAARASEPTFTQQLTGRGELAEAKRSLRRVERTAWRSQARRLESELSQEHHRLVRRLPVVRRQIELGYHIPAYRDAVRRAEAAGDPRAAETAQARLKRAEQVAVQRYEFTRRQQLRNFAQQRHRRQRQLYRGYEKRVRSMHQEVADARRDYRRQMGAAF